ncbi:hypothetical protein CAP42_01780 [Acinetobacter indicus]|uniref:hypothetical protein n=1 Tax=Acinetobacter indicus TaxID=756892 RepID=UPI0005F82FB0|nr:hypothetical protein [Acinetobacter indicus]KJV44476.1 hypothetical protein VH96_06525 [Acinetobacter indicus]OUY11033.1 hypothetical protein CAP42_01780 [Acinetobacter indicus]
MANEKQTSLRILQSNKPKSPSPLLYSLGGFVAGLVVTGLAGYAYFYAGQPSTTLAESTQAMAAPAVTPSELPAELEELKNQMTDHSGSFEELEDVQTEHPVEFQQPNDGELSKIFAHQPAKVAAQPAPSQARVAPNFPQEMASAPAATAKQPPAPAKAVPAKPAAPVVVPMAAVEPEETPQASVQISVARKPVEKVETVSVQGTAVHP